MAWKNPWYNPALTHHRPTGFSNPQPYTHSSADYRRWRAQRKAEKLPHAPQGGYPAFIRRWWQQADFNQPQGDGVWWLGHACLLLRLDGHYLLTDPVFSKRASPLWFYGPQRKTPLPFHPDELPLVDAVLISHNHYDHLDRATVRYLCRRFPKLAFFVPLGLKSWFRGLGIERVTELDWWQQARCQGLMLHCVPAQHWSMRSLWDRNRSLWCGWLAESHSQRFWFSGDTGYSEHLTQIPQRLGKLTAAAIPIGAYQPRWFMAQNHMDPQSAVRLWRQLERPLAIPIHWGVFELADESLDMPVAELQASLRQPSHCLSVASQSSQASSQPSLQPSLQLQSAEAHETAENFAPLAIGGYLSLTSVAQTQEVYPPYDGGE